MILFVVTMVQPGTSPDLQQWASVTGWYNKLVDLTSRDLSPPQIQQGLVALLLYPLHCTLNVCMG